MPAEAEDAAAPLPRRVSLAAQTAACLRRRLEQGVWQHELPGEMALARELQVGRNTLRSALKALEREGLLLVGAGSRRRVTGTTARPQRSAARTAILLLSAPLHVLPSSTLPWMESLRQQLQGGGWVLRIVVEAAAYHRSPAPVLEALVEHEPEAVWILHRSTAAMQRWFQARSLATVIAGTQHEGITLPQVDTDYRAASRHAAGRIAALGHRHAAILQSQNLLAGDAESVAGFREGAGGLDVVTGIHDDTTSGFTAALRRLISGAQPPTALFILRTDHFATALTWLLLHGIAVPGGMSLVCRDDHPFLSHLCPEPSRYRRSADEFAKKLARFIMTLGDGIQPLRPRHLIMPAFVKGETLGAAPVPKRNR